MRQSSFRRETTRGGLALLEEAVATARRVLGAAHSMTLDAIAKCKQGRAKASLRQPGACALGTLVGLNSRLDLNGSTACVVGFDNSCYRVYPEFVKQPLADADAARAGDEAARPPCATAPQVHHPHFSCTRSSMSQDYSALTPGAR